MFLKKFFNAFGPKFGLPTFSGKAALLFFSLAVQNHVQFRHLSQWKLQMSCTNFHKFSRELNESRHKRRPPMNATKMDIPSVIQFHTITPIVMATARYFVKLLPKRYPLPILSAFVFVSFNAWNHWTLVSLSFFCICYPCSDVKF